jgi:alpha-galactosidase
MQKNFGFKSVGLCHSVQVCAERLLDSLQMSEHKDTCITEIAGINHQAWLLSIKDKNGNDLYPEIKRRSLDPKYADGLQWDLVRHDMMHRFGYYNTESSEHTSEYNPYYIKRHYPELIDRFKIPLDEYPRRCVEQIKNWKKQKEELTNPDNIKHERSREYGSRIIEACETGEPYKIYGNVLNTGLITNLPSNACVEVPIMVDENGLNPCFVGDLPDQLAGLNMQHITVHNLTIDGAVNRKKEYVYRAAYLDPHTRDQLTLDEIKSLCDDLFEAHKDWLPDYE